jgi:predicted PurR-regulated permease PerM
MYHELLERYRILRVLVWLVTIISAIIAINLIWSLLIHFSGIILLFFLAWVINFILQPLSTLLEHRRVPRLLAVSLIYLALFAVAAGGILLAIPTIHGEVQFIASELTGTLTSTNLTNLANRAVAYLHSVGLSEKDARSLVGQFSNRIPELTSTLANNAVQTTATLLGAAINLLFNTLLVLVLSFYMMLDGDRLVAGWIEKLPPAWLPDIRTLQRHIDQVFGGFLRAQLIIALVFGIVTYTVLAILGQPNGLIFAIVAALLMLIPFIGPVLALVPPLSLILLQSSPDSVVWKLIVAGAALAIAEWVVLQFVAPLVMRAHVGLHPLLLFAALLIGAEESGIWGAVFAGPVAAVLVAVFDTFFERFRQASNLYALAPSEATPILTDPACDEPGSHFPTAVPDTHQVVTNTESRSVAATTERKIVDPDTRAQPAPEVR